LKRPRVEARNVEVDVKELSIAKAKNAKQYNPKENEPVEIIQVYTNKGGVTKTTTTLNLAFALAKEAKSNVLVVDFDAQGDLTHDALYSCFWRAQHRMSWKDVLDAVFHRAGQQFTKNDSGAVEEEYNFYTVDGVINGFFFNRDWDHVGARVNGKFEVPAICCMQLGKIVNGHYKQEISNPHDMEQYLASLHAAGNSVESRRKTTKPEVVTLEDTPAVFLAAGGVGLDDLNATFHLFNPGDNSNLRHDFNSAYGILRAVIKKTARRYRCKHVLVDCSPSTLLREQIAFTNSDWLVSPTLACLQSGRALLRMRDSLSKAMDSHHGQTSTLDAVRSRNTSTKQIYRGKNLQINPTLFIGTVLTNYHSWNNLKATKAAQINIDYVKKCSAMLRTTLFEVPQTLVPHAPDAQRHINNWQAAYLSAINNSHEDVKTYGYVAQVEDMQSFGDLSRHHGCVQIAVTDEDCKKFAEMQEGTSLKSDKRANTITRARNRAQKSFQTAASRILKFIADFREHQARAQAQEA
jgi:cellulose biosynthesis protein BcsQ